MRLSPCNLQECARGVWSLLTLSDCRRRAKEYSRRRSQASKYGWFERLGTMFMDLYSSATLAPTPPKILTPGNLVSHTNLETISTKGASHTAFHILHRNLFPIKDSQMLEHDVHSRDVQGQGCCRNGVFFHFGGLVFIVILWLWCRLGGWPHQEGLCCPKSLPNTFILLPCLPQARLRLFLSSHCAGSCYKPHNPEESKMLWMQTQFK